MQNTQKQSYVLQVELLVENVSNAAALEQVIHALNAGGFVDYRILSGVQLGQVIDQRKADAAVQVPMEIDFKGPTQNEKQTQSNKSAANGKSAPSAKDKDVPSVKAAKPKVVEPSLSDPYDGFADIRGFMKSNKLIRLIVNKGLGITLSIPCRILNVDDTTNMITVYHVDEKQVYTFKLNEIEDYIS
ncbi:hypothetical protein BBD42_00320 [Paenibacillus sp. BIHB 4019]|uniref:Uncharacterized protein n=1 Tax=Paenibacillus sp. BIHB 4019 TaxID=1870819 RepID=A0A1B2DBK1_9BACL|nr:hypothetical protein [Paenibacillus sp. BIHB 4019]ANY65093.1 hypothetical protein BBD42_00320 [Paenibacillus sp. BIHB 4019]